jgi:hypothetical protein
MGYEIYKVGPRWGGYGVPAICEQPECNEKIDRGISYACGGEPFSDHGCDRYFCGKHLVIMYIDLVKGDFCKHKKDCDCVWTELCQRCAAGKPPFPYKPELKEWIKHLLTDHSWQEWRNENPKKVEELKKQYGKQINYIN